MQLNRTVKIIIIEIVQSVTPIILSDTVIVNDINVQTAHKFYLTINNIS